MKANPLDGGDIYKIDFLNQYISPHPTPLLPSPQPRFHENYIFKFLMSAGSVVQHRRRSGHKILPSMLKILGAIELVSI